MGDIFKYQHLDFHFFFLIKIITIHRYSANKPFRAFSQSSVIFNINNNNNNNNLKRGVSVGLTQGKYWPSTLTKEKPQPKEL